MPIVCAVFFFACLPAAEEAADRPVQARPATSCPAPLEEDAIPARANPWFFLFSLENVYPRLESENMVTYYDDFMRLMAHGFKDVRTVSGLRDAHILWVPNLGFGRTLSPKWSVFLQTGFSKGTVRTKANTPSVILLPLHTDFEIKRGALYALIGTDFFPWGNVVMRDYNGFWGRLRAVRPGFGLRQTWTFATYGAKAKFGTPHLHDLVSIHLHDSWLLPSVTPVVDLEMPLGKRDVLHFDAGYSFFSRQKEDFEGPVLTVGWKHFFK